MSDTTQLADQYLHDCATSPDVSNKISKGKSVSYVIDTNQGSYTTGIVTLDCSNQLTGAQGYAALKEAYVTVPYVVSLKNTGADIAGTPTLNPLMVGMKCNTATIIDKVQIEINGKTIVTPSSHLSHWNNLRAMTEWSETDVEKLGASALMYPDDTTSISFNSTAAANALQGDGYANTHTNTAATLSTAFGGQAEKLGNTGFIKRLLNNPPPISLNGTPQSPYGWASIGASASQQIAAQTGKGACVGGATTGGSTMGTWYYLHRIRLVDIHPIFKELDLCANPQLKLTLYINTGVSNILMDYTAGGPTRSLQLESTTMTQGVTCPVMLSSAAAGSVNATFGFTTATADSSLQLAWGVMGNQITQSGAGAYYPYATTRMYVPFYDLHPEKALEIVKQPVKKSRFLDYFYYPAKGQAGEGVVAGKHDANFSIQVSGSQKNIKYVALLPYANTKSGHYAKAGVANIDQYASPFDSAPWTCQPGSAITNFNVQVGNKWVFNAAQNYDFQGFLDEFSKLGALNGSLTHELSNGLIDEDKWSMAQRILVADVSRITEKDVPTSIMITGTNSGSQGTDFVVLVAYEREIALDRVTGEVASFT